MGWRAFPSLLGGLCAGVPLSWGRERCLFISLREAGRSARSRALHGKASHPHCLSWAGWLCSPEAGVSLQQPQPTWGRAGSSCTPLIRGGEASPAGHCDLKWLQEAVSDMPGTGTCLQPTKPGVYLQGLKMGIPSPIPLGLLPGEL